MGCNYMKIKTMHELKEVLESNIAELNDYINGDDYDDLEQHDMCIAIETYQYVIDLIS